MRVFFDEERVKRWMAASARPVSTFDLCAIQAAEILLICTRLNNMAFILQILDDITSQTYTSAQETAHVYESRSGIYPPQVLSSKNRP